ncbi:hypothetical protein N7501_003337 [Penicillium viridicatum]|nr:hypothetical protein N7501_003337 [Penicillium viridicatum]
MSSPPPSAASKKRLSGRLFRPNSEALGALGGDNGGAGGDYVGVGAAGAAVSGPAPVAGAVPGPAPPAGPAPVRVSDPNHANMDTNGLRLLSSLNKSGVDDQFAQMLPVRTAVDWRANRPAANRSARNGMPLRAVVGQLCGHQAPAGDECGNCSKGNDPFVHCRVVLFPDGKYHP